MVEIVTKYVKEGKIFNRRRIEKVGLEGSVLYDGIIKQCEKLICFYNRKERRYYLHSLVSGKLIAKSPHLIHCINNEYFWINTVSNDKYLYHIDHAESSNCTDTSDFTEKNRFNAITIYSNGVKFISNNFDYDCNWLVECKNDKVIYITNILTNENQEFSFNELPDSELYSVSIDKLNGLPNIFKVKITCNNYDSYFNIFYASEGKLLYNEWLKGVIKDSKIYNNKLYIVTYNNELIDPIGKVVISPFYNDIFFHNTLPFVYLIKNEKRGLANLDGEIIFEAIYDEVMETPDKFIVNVCETKEYTKKQINK